MKVIVDTCIWSYALRRDIKIQEPHVQELKELINEVRVQLIGPIRQEILSGVKTKKQFQSLKLHLQAFQDLRVETEDFELAAEFFNKARSKGIQGSNTDFLICAMASRHKMSIFTTDNDFTNYEKYLPVTLHQPRK